MTTRKFALAALPVLAIALIATFSIAQSETKPKPADTPTIIAIKFHADWCGSCKTVSPIVNDLTNKLDTKPVLFVTLDMTTQSTRKQAEYLAASLGIGNIWPQYGKTTGKVLLFDAKTRQIVGKLDKTMDIKQMGAAINDAIAAAEHAHHGHSHDGHGH